MALRLVFLGRLADAAGAAEREEPAVPDLATLLAALPAELAQALGDHRVRVAINGALASDARAYPLADGDEIAFLPPVSGG